MTEAELASRLHRDLGPLAADAEWSTAPTSGQAQGHYTDPIADAKEAAGVEDDLNDDEVTAAVLKKVRRLALSFCFDRLAIHYVGAVDHSADGASESLSQILANIERAKMIACGSVVVGVNLRGKSKPDWTANDGNIEEVEE